MTLQQVYESTIKSGGATFGADMVLRRSGWAVGGLSAPVRLPVPGSTQKGFYEALVALQRNLDLPEPRIFGSWVYQGEIWLEPVELFDSEPTALRAARVRREIALYCLHTGQEILV